MPINTYITSELAGLDPFVDYAGLANDQERMDAFYTLLAQEHTQTQRGHLDQISPAAHRQLLVEVLALKDALDGAAGATQAIIDDSDQLTITDGDSNTGTAEASVSASTITAITLDGTFCIVESGDILSVGGPATVTFTVAAGVLSGVYDAGI